MAKAAVKKSKDKADEDQAEFPLLAYLDELVDDLREHVSGALKVFDVDAIHDSRVSTRRLKAALDLLEPVLSRESREPFATVLKKLRRRLGPLRDQDVMLEHLGELGKTAQYRPASQWLCHRLEEERACERDKARQKSTPASVLARLGTWWGLREEVAEAEEAVGSLLAQSLHLQLDAFIEQADLIAGQERHAPAARPETEKPAANGVPHSVENAEPARSTGSTGSTSSPQASSGHARPELAEGAHRQDPHELRIAGKALRYTLDMARHQGHPLPTDVAKSFKKMQEALGMWHDFVVLTEKALTLSSRGLLAHRDAPMQVAVLDLARWTMRRASRELEKFAGLWGRKGPGLTQTIRSAFPLSRSLQEAQKTEAEAKKPQALTEPKTGPDPIDSEGTPPPEDAARAVPAAV
jgi:CHAD domain-containing protein